MSIVIIPTYNEAENIAELKRRLPADVKVLIVDDSPNSRTSEAAQEAGFAVLRRNDKRGLSSAVIDGVRFTDTEKVVVMDADLQHPPELIPRILDELETHDFVVASRYVDGGGCEDRSLDRRVISKTANLAARPLTPVKDAVSGFFGLRRSGLPELNSLNDRGFKIMLELLVKGNWNNVIEVPYIFGVRGHGRTKLGFEQIWSYLIQLASLYSYKFRWLRFGIVGASGLLVHTSFLYAFTEFASIWYLLSSIMAIVIASTSNYFLNHYWTFRERHEAKHSHLRGWLKYQLMSGVTDGIYLGLLALITEVVGVWYIASSVIAVLIVFVIKYIVAKKWIWKKDIS